MYVDHNAIREERKVLMVRLVEGKEIRPSWTYFKRRGIRVRTKILRYINRTTTGRFAMGKKYIAFELEADALMYRVMYPE